MPIPSARVCQTNWQSAGMLAEGGIPARATIYTTIDAATYGNGASDARADIQAAIDACPTGQTVLLSSGVFRIDNYLYAKSGITLRGAGAGLTILRNVNGGVRDNTDLVTAAGNSLGILVVGTSLFPHWQNTSLMTLTANAAKGDTTVTVDSVAGRSPGEYVVISEDHFNTGSWEAKPDDNGAANHYENWQSDKIRWARNRLVGTPVTITSSDAGTDRFTLPSDLPFEAGSLVYLEGHSGTLSPAAADGYYRVYDKPTATTLRLQTIDWNNTIIDVTAGGTGGTITANRPGEYQQAGGTIDPDDSWLAWHSRGYGHVYGETKRIASINGGTNQITFESPLTTDYRTSHTAQIAICDQAPVENFGVEKMSFHRGSHGAIRFQHAAKCWAYNVEVYEWIGHGIHVEKSYRVHLEGCTVRYANWRYPGGGSYCVAIYDQSAECLVANCILVDANKAIAVNAAGAGCVLVDSYTDDTVVWSDQGWMETGPNASHFAGSHHMLIEGCYGPNGDSDNTHGSSQAITYHRCHFAGRRTSYTDVTNRRCFGLGYGSLGMSLTGCVLGVSGGMSGWALDGTDFSDPTDPVVYKLGYDPGAWNQEADPDVIADFYDADNWNYLNNEINAAEAGTTPNSYVYASAPAYFGGQAWPWVTPTAGTKLATLPAKYRWEQGDWNNLALFGPGGGGGGPTPPALEGAAFAQGSDDAPTVTYSATAGRLLTAWVTVNGTSDISDPSAEWTAVPQLAVFANFRARLFYKLATGSDTIAFALSAAASWTISVQEWSGTAAVPLLRTYAQQEQNSTTPESGATPDNASEDDLVLSALCDSYETAPITEPSGYTQVLASPGPVFHYGTSFVMMGAVAWKAAAGGTTENAAWTRDGGFSGVGVYVFAAGEAEGGGGGDDLTWMPRQQMAGGRARHMTASGMSLSSR